MSIENLLAKLETLEAQNRYLLIAATGNAFKLDEIKRNMASPKWDIVGLKDLAKILSCEYATLDSEESEQDVQSIALGKVTKVQQYIKSKLHEIDSIDSPLLNQILWLSDDYGVKWDVMPFEKQTLGPLSVKYSQDQSAVTGLATSRADLVGEGGPNIFAHRMLMSIAKEKFPHAWSDNQIKAEDKAFELFARSVIEIVGMKKREGQTKGLDCTAILGMAWGQGLGEAKVIHKIMDMPTSEICTDKGYLYDRMACLPIPNQTTSKTIGQCTDEERDLHGIRGHAFREITGHFNKLICLVPSDKSAPKNTSPHSSMTMSMC